MILVGRKYLFVSWRTGSPRPDGRRYRFRHNALVKNVYIQIGRLETVLWYR